MYCARFSVSERGRGQSRPFSSARLRAARAPVSAAVRFNRALRHPIGSDDELMGRAVVEMELSANGVRFETETEGGYTTTALLIREIGWRGALLKQTPAYTELCSVALVPSITQKLLGHE